MTFLHVFVLLFFLFVAFDIYKTVAFLRRAHPHVGHVLALNDIGMYDPFYSYTVEFNRGVEDPHEVDVDIGCHLFNHYEVGAEVEILYDPLKNKGRLNTFWHVSRNSIIYFFFLPVLIFLIVM